MKHCPKCLRNYSDKTLDFCLDDGARLILADTEQTVTFKNAEKTEILPQFTNPLDKPNQTEAVNFETNRHRLKEKAIRQGYKTLEIGGLVLALSHNYWQWLYVDKPDLYNPLAFLLSGGFVVWLFLLASGIVAGIFGIRYCQNKGFPIVSLVILAINLILFIVPRR